MPYENINHQLNDQELDSIQTSLIELKTQLSFLVNLTPHERKQRGPVIRKGEYFIQTAYEIAQQETQLLPAAISLSEWEADLRLLQQLKPIRNQIAQLHEGLQDTCMALQTELTQRALTFRKVLESLKQQQIPGIDIMLKKLEQL